MNPNVVAPAVGPVVPGVNDCAGPYTGGIANQGIFCQFRGLVPGMNELGDVFFNVDPGTGKNFRGLEADSTRINLQGEWDVGVGVIKSWAGYYEGHTHSIQDWQAGGNPAFCGTYVDPETGAALVGDDFPSFEDQGCVIGYNNNEHFIDQWSLELQFQSGWDHWQQLTVGGLHWYEDRDVFDKGGTQRARSIECAINDTFDTVIGPCGFFSVPITGEIFQDILDTREIAQFGLIDGQIGNRETFHWSAYFQGDTDLNRLANDLFGNMSLPGQWSLITEARWNHETTEANGLDSSASGSTGASICCGGPIFGAGDFPEDANINACSGTLIDFAVGGGSGGPTLVPPTTTPFNNLDADFDTFRTPFCAFSDEELATIGMGRSGDVDLFALHINCDGDPQAPRKFCEITNNWWTGKVTLQWEPTDDMLWYFSHAWASKPGGLSTIAFGSAGFQPSNDKFVAEKMRVYELGVKSSWFGNTLQVNDAGYFQDFTDKQVNSQRVVFDPVSMTTNTSPLVVNASSAEVWGGELDVLWAPDVNIFGGEVVFSGSYTYLRTKYVDFKTRNFSGTDIHETLSCEPELDPTFLTAGITLPSCIIDRSGNEMEDAPKQAANLLKEWNRPLLDDWNLFLEQDTQYVGKRFIEDTNAGQIDKW